MPKRKNKRHNPPPKKRWRTSRIFTWVGLGCLAIAIVVLGFFAFAGGESSPRPRVRQTPVVTDERQFTIEVVDNDFQPKNLTVRAGTEVNWDFKGRAAHDVTEESGAFRSGTLGRGDEFILTFDEPGTYNYYCTLHHVMQGIIVVQP